MLLGTTKAGKPAFVLSAYYVAISAAVNDENADVHRTNGR
jgi:hypothetical protein